MTDNKNDNDVKLMGSAGAGGTTIGANVGTTSSTANYGGTVWIGDYPITTSSSYPCTQDWTLPRYTYTQPAENRHIQAYKIAKLMRERGYITSADEFVGLVEDLLKVI